MCAAMNDKEALQASSRGQKLDQPTIKRLWGRGYIEVRDVTNQQSTGKEYLPTFITEAGRKVLEG